MKTDGNTLERRDGITHFEDYLGSVASHAAMELDFIRLGRTSSLFTDWKVRALGGWFLEFSRGELPTSSVFSDTFVYDLSKRMNRELPSTHRDSLKPLAEEIGRALFQSIHFDPTHNGWARIDLIHLCCDISRLARASPHYGRRRSRPGAWRGVNWWRPASEDRS